MKQISFDYFKKVDMRVGKMAKVGRIGGIFKCKICGNMVKVKEVGGGTTSML